MNNAPLIVFDVDGTLINDEKVILTETILIVRELVEKYSAEIVLASARSPRSLKVISKKLGVRCGYVCFNGAISYSSDKSTSSGYLISMPFNKVFVKEFVSVLLRYKISVSVFSENLWIASHEDYWLAREIKGTYLHPDRIGENEVVHLAQNHPIHKILCRGEETEINSAKQEILSVLGEGGIMYSDRPTAIEISPSNTSKLAAVLALTKHHGHKHENVWVFGDADNDLDLVKYFTNSVALGNGSEALKKAAQYVIGSNNEPSIAEFLREHLLLT